MGYFLYLEVSVHHRIILGSLPYGGVFQTLAWNDCIIEAQEIDSICGLQIAAALGTAITWQKALREWPQVLGKENPFNDQIEAIFKDQGGYWLPNCRNPHAIYGGASTSQDD